MKKIFTSLFLLHCATSVTASETSNLKDAMNFADKTNGALELILSVPTDTPQFNDLFERYIEHYYDIAIITKYLLGPDARNMSQDELKKFETEVKIYITNKYSVLFANLQNMTTEIKNVLNQNDEKFIITTEVSNSKEYHHIDFVISSKSGEYKIVNIQFDMFSLLKNEREHFNNLWNASKNDTKKLLSLINK